MKRLTYGLVLGALVAAAPAAAQGVVVDEGEFEIRIGGQVVGTEEFLIRRAGLGLENQLFANGAVTVDVEGGQQEIRPLLSVRPPEGVAVDYRVRVTGPGEIEIVLNQRGRRYVGRITSPTGVEDREFPAREDTRILEQDVAHHYYFLRDLYSGRSAHVLEPRSQRQIDLIAESRDEVQIVVGRNTVEARRVVFSAGEDRRTVWFDRLGRVLRVEVPARSYVAERTDVVG